jgi:hypothetical protein
MNPFADTIAFLTRNEWPIYVFWLLLLGSLGIAVVNLLQDPAQRTGRHVWMWLARLLIGGLWWQQTEFYILGLVEHSFLTGAGGAPFGSTGFIVNCPIVQRLL